MADSMFYMALKNGKVSTRSLGTVVKVLEQVCRDITAFGGKHLGCRLLPGSLTNLGQEYRVTLLAAKSNSPEHILFRAYLPVQGVPCYLDFYDDQMVKCEQVKDIKQQIADFLGRSTTVEQIVAFREALQIAPA